jgi:ketosteroid isomerase-like protein
VGAQNSGGWLKRRLSVAATAAATPTQALMEMDCITRLVEAGDQVLAEGSVRAPRTDGTVMNLVFSDVLEMPGGKIRQLTSCLMEIK